METLRRKGKGGQGDTGRECREGKGNGEKGTEKERECCETTRMEKERREGKRRGNENGEKGRKRREGNGKG